MFGWGKRRGSSRRAFNNVVVIQEDCPDPKDKGGKSLAKKPVHGHGDNGDSDDDHEVIVRDRCSILQLSAAIGFAVGLTATIGSLALALAFHAGASNPIDVDVEHIAGSCLFRGSGADSLSPQARQVLGLNRAHDFDDRHEGEGGAITIYVPCPNYDDDTGYDDGRAQ